MTVFRSPRPTPCRPPERRLTFQTHEGLRARVSTLGAPPTDTHRSRRAGERRGPPVVVQRRGDAAPDQEFFDPAAAENGPVGSNDDPSFGSPKDHVERLDGLRLGRHRDEYGHWTSFITAESETLRDGVLSPFWRDIGLECRETLL
jgi:hypothetical protein